MFSDRRHRCALYDIQPLFVSYHLTISLCNIRTSKQLSELLSSLLCQLSLLYWNQFLLPHMFIHINNITEILIFHARPCLQMQILPDRKGTFVCTSMPHPMFTFIKSCTADDATSPQFRSSICDEAAFFRMRIKMVCAMHCCPFQFRYIWTFPL